MTKTGSVRVGAALAIAGMIGAAPVGVASANHEGPPVIRNCIGTTFATAAAALPPGGFGAVIKGFAQAPDGRPGLGDGIQALQNGDVDDAVATNTCND